MTIRLTSTGKLTQLSPESRTSFRFLAPTHFPWRTNSCLHKEPITAVSHTEMHKSLLRVYSAAGQMASLTTSRRTRRCPVHKHEVMIYVAHFFCSWQPEAVHIFTAYMWQMHFIISLPNEILQSIWYSVVRYTHLILKCVLWLADTVKVLQENYSRKWRWWYWRKPQLQTTNYESNTIQILGQNILGCGSFDRSTSLTSTVSLKCELAQSMVQLWILQT